MSMTFLYVRSRQHSYNFIYLFQQPTTLQETTDTEETETAVDSSSSSSASTQPHPISQQVHGLFAFILSYKLYKLGCSKIPVHMYDHAKKVEVPFGLCLSIEFL